MKVTPTAEAIKKATDQAAANGQAAPATAAALEVLGGAIKKDGTFHVDSFNVTGDAQMIAELFTDEAKKLFDPDIATWITKLDQTKLTMGKGTNLNAKTSDSGVTSTLDALEVAGQVTLQTDVNKTVVVPAAHLTFKPVTLSYDKNTKTTVLGAGTAHVDGSVRLSGSRLGPHGSG